MRWEKFRRTVDDAQTVFVHDTVKNGKVNGHLRALPAILYAGFDDVTCPKRFLSVGDYRRHQLYEDTWHLLQDLDGQTQMPHMDRIEAAAENADAHGSLLVFGKHALRCAGKRVRSALQ